MPAASVTPCSSQMPTSKTRVREGLRRRAQPCRLAHRGGDGDDPLVLPHQSQHGLAEDVAVGGRRRPAVAAVAVRREAVEAGGVLLGRRVALALLRQHVDDGRLLLGVAGANRGRFDVAHVVAVDRPDVVEAELLPEGAGDQRALEPRLEPGDAAAGSGRRRADATACSSCPPSRARSAATGSAGSGAWRRRRCSARSPCRCR